ncbi:PAS domain S-box protein [Pannus brasiliensis CCIBt3594]|uniref:histidine kinase n=1 Tax=Pannus brasiliensis CCIBt3594 TaxID=1427578 RepID=A0AAW9QLI7_9CHRO
MTVPTRKPLCPKIPLCWVLIVPFALQISGAVGLVGYLSYRSGERAVEKLADRLIVETGNRVEQELETYLGRARKTNLANVAAFETGALDLNDFNSIGKYFYRQVRLYDFAYVNFGGADGSFIGAGYGLNNVIGIAEISPSDPRTLRAYSIDERGNRKKLRAMVPARTNQAAWYTDAVRAGKPVWSEIYTWGNFPDRISISASAPVYDERKKLLGVLGIDLELSGIGRFLQKLDRGNSGQIFIFERKSGKLVATSTKESPAPIIGGKARRITGEESRDPIVRQVSRELRARFGDFRGISAPALSRLEIDRRNLFVRVIPYRDDYGIDWLTVVIVPESEFMTEIWHNWRNTIALCGLTLFVTTGLGIFFARRIARSIYRVSRASRLLAAGKWEESLEETSFIAEIDTLNRSFHRTAEQLRSAFDRVKIALQESETKFSKVFRSCPDPMSLNTLGEGGRYVEVNDSFLELSGYSREEIIGRTPKDVGLGIEPRQEEILEEKLKERGFIRGFEYFYRTRAGKSGTCLLSIEIVEIEGKLYTLSISKDITDRKLAEKKQRESELKFAKLFQISPDPAWIGILPEGRILDVNENMARFWGYSIEEVNCKTCRELELWHNIEDFSYFQKTLTEEGRIENWEVIVRDRSRTPRTVLLSATLHRFDGQDFVLGMIKDISERKEAERELQRTRHWLDQFSLHSPSIIYTVVARPDGLVRFEYMSAACETILEVASEWVIENGNAFIDMIHPDDLAAYREAVARSAERMETFSHQWRVITPSGNIKWLQGKSRPERRQNGSIAWYGVVVDITEQKRVERELQRALQQIETHFENSPLAIVQWDKDFRVLRWSKQAERVFGWRSEEIPVLPIDLIYPEDRERSTEHLHRLLSGTVKGESILLRNYTKDGRLITCQWYSSAILDDSGDFHSCLAFAWDITDRVKAEECLRESEERFRSAFEDTGNGMALVALDGRFLQVNRSLCEMIGYGEAELLTKGFQDITHPDDASANLEGLERLLTGQIRVYRVEKRYLHASGRIVWGSVTVSTITDKAGNPLYFVVQIQDISERHQLDRLKDEFISIVSHELRTPLTSIRGSLGILATGVLEKDPETANRMLKVALNSSERLVRLVNDILDLERLESGKVELVMENHDIGDLLDQAIESVSALAAERSIVIEVNFPRVRVRADGDAIIQTLTNLLGNAIKFSPDRSTVRLTARVRDGETISGEIAGDREALFRQNYPDPYLLFAVEDSGRGIPIDKLETIFGRFQQVDVSDARQKGGTGLGLAICKSIVRKHGGAIWAESELERGSTFYFTLPGL